MDAFELDQLKSERERTGLLFLEFLTVPTMSAGLYELPAGAVDPQAPHTEDEIYYVVSGRATISVAGEDQPVQPGTTIFVGAGVDHRFHSIAEDLSLLVVFAPARGSRAAG